MMALKEVVAASFFCLAAATAVAAMPPLHLPPHSYAVFAPEDEHGNASASSH